MFWGLYIYIYTTLALRFTQKAKNWAVLLLTQKIQLKQLWLHLENSWLLPKSISDLESYSSTPLGICAHVPTVSAHCYSWITIYWSSFGANNPGIWRNQKEEGNYGLNCWYFWRKNSSCHDNENVEYSKRSKLKYMIYSSQRKCYTYT